jgi:hypothetical protein
MLDGFIKLLESEFNEFQNTGIAKGGVYLKEKTGQHLNHNNYPHYFTGDFNSKIVFVHLNPKEKNTDSDIFGGEFKFASFQEYFDFYQRYGTHRYRNPESDFKSRFDQKQLKLLKGLNIMTFLSEENDKRGKIRRENLATALDEKLQLELVPYGSDNFETIPNDKIECLNDYINNILDLIVAKERDYIFFCGEVFTRLLAKYLVSNEEHNISVFTKEGKEKSSYFHKLEINYKGKHIKAGILRTYPQPGFDGDLITQYGKRVKELY